MNIGHYYKQLRIKEDVMNTIDMFITAQSINTLNFNLKRPRKNPNTSFWVRVDCEKTPIMVVKNKGLFKTLYDLNLGSKILARDISLQKTVEFVDQLYFTSTSARALFPDTSKRMIELLFADATLTKVMDRISPLDETLQTGDKKYDELNKLFHPVYRLNKQINFINQGYEEFNELKRLVEERNITFYLQSMKIQIDSLGITYLLCKIYAKEGFGKEEREFLDSLLSETVEEEKMEKGSVSLRANKQKEDEYVKLSEAKSFKLYECKTTVLYNNGKEIYKESDIIMIVKMPSETLYNKIHLVNLTNGTKTHDDEPIFIRSEVDEHTKLRLLSPDEVVEISN